MSSTSRRARRGGGAVAALGLALVTVGAGASGAAAAATAPLVDPAPPAPARGLPLERLPREVAPMAGGPAAAAEAAVPADGGAPAADDVETAAPADPGAAGSAGGSAGGDEAVPGWEAPESLVWLTAAGGALAALLLRQRALGRRAEEEPGGGEPEVLIGTPALVHELSRALADSRDGGEPVGLVVLRVEALLPPGAATSPPPPEGPGGVDAVLEALDGAVPLVARLVGRRRRGADTLVRLGVNRLAVVLPGSGAAETRAVAERLRAAVAVAPHLAVQVGSASAPADGPVPSALLRAADGSLTGGARALAP